MKLVLDCGCELEGTGAEGLRTGMKGRPCPEHVGQEGLSIADLTEAEMVAVVKLLNRVLK